MNSLNSLNTCLFIDLKAIRRFVLYDAALVVLNIVVISNFLCCINYLNLVYSYYNLSTRVQIEKRVCVNYKRCGGCFRPSQFFKYSTS